MKLKFLVGTLVFLIVLNLVTIGTFVYIQLKHSERGSERMFREGRFPPPWRRGPSGRHLAEEDRMKLMSLLVEFREETQETRERIRQLEGEMLTLLREDPVSTARVDSVLAEVSALRMTLSREATRKLIEAKEFLTPEQQQFFFDAIMKARPMHPGGRPPFRGDGPPFKRPRKRGDRT